MGVVVTLKIGFVDRFKKALDSADLPIKFLFVVNLKAAKQIGLMIPNRVLEPANQVIK